MEKGPGDDVVNTMKELIKAVDTAPKDTVQAGIEKADAELVLRDDAQGPQTTDEKLDE